MLGEPAVWDCHTHVFGDPSRFPLAAGRRYTPSEAWLPALRTHLRAVGATRVVLVQPTVYGHDHGCLLKALDELGTMAVGIAACPPPGGGLPDHGRIVGLRVDLRGRWSALHDETLRRATRIAAAAGAHIEAQVDPAALAMLSRSLGEHRAPLVLDHLAGLSPNSDPAEIAVFDDLVAHRSVYAKLSALERSPGGPASALPLVQRIARHAPGKLLWGSDWPHTPPHPPPALRSQPLPFRTVDDRTAMASLEQALGAAILTRIRSENPARLYGRLL